MRQWLEDLSVRAKLTLLTVGACTAVLALASSVYVYGDRVSSYQAKERTLSVLGGVMAQTLAGPVAFRDEASTRTVVANLASEPTATLAAVYVADGSLLAGWSPEGAAAPPTLTEATGTSGGMVILTPVAGADGQVLGQLVTRYSTRDLDARLWTFLQISVLVALFSLATVSGVFWLARRRLTRPIDELADAALRVRQANDYGVRVTRTSKDELGVLATTFNAMLEGIQERDAELRAHQEDLEGLVAERTSELDERNRGMRTVLDSVEQGIVVLDRSAVIGNERSAAFDRWFGVPDTGSTLHDHLVSRSASFAAFFELGWEMLVEDLMPREVCLDQLPSRLELGDQVFELCYRVLDDEGPIERVLVVVSDITAEEIAARMDVQQRELANIFTAVQQDAHGFRAFIEEGDAIVRDLAPEAAVEPAVVFRRVHTLKGNAALQGLLELPPLCHDLETRLAEGELASEEDLETVCGAWNRFRDRVQPMLPKAWALQLDDEDCRTLLRLATPLPAIHDQITYLQGESVETRLGALAARARSLGSRLGKPVEVVTGKTSLRAPKGELDGVWNALPHALRNALDHGIEGDRVAVGKAERGRIGLEARLGLVGELSTSGAPFLGGMAPDDRAIALVVADDGRGIDWGRVEGKGRELGLPVDTPQALLEVLFHDGVSTADAVTDLSGRGVGTSALLAEVVERGGRLQVHSQPGEGTTLTVFLPVKGWVLPTPMGDQRRAPVLAG